VPSNKKTVAQLWQKSMTGFYWSISGTFVGGYDPSGIFSVCCYFADTVTVLIHW